jgi:hypothetical protein
MKLINIKEIDIEEIKKNQNQNQNKKFKQKENEYKYKYDEQEKYIEITLDNLKENTVYFFRIFSKIGNFSSNSSKVFIGKTCKFISEKIKKFTIKNLLKLNFEKNSNNNNNKFEITEIQKLQNLGENNYMEKYKENNSDKLEEIKNQKNNQIKNQKKIRFQILQH